LKPKYAEISNYNKIPCTLPILSQTIPHNNMVDYYVFDFTVSKDSLHHCIIELIKTPPTSHKTPNPKNEIPNKA